MLKKEFANRILYIIIMKPSKTILQGSKFIPRTNLPKKFQIHNIEDQFVNAFLKTYIKTVKSSSLFIKETPAPCLGIADVLHCAGVEKSNGHITRIRGLLAFEMKIGHWKKALLQAHKYSYFADKVIVVLPVEKSNAAINNIQWFEKLGISLWAFDMPNKKIKKLLDFKRTHASSLKERKKIVEKIRKLTVRHT